MNNNRNRVFIIIISIILTVAVAISSVTAGLLKATSGTEVDCSAEVQTYNASVPDTNSLYKGVSTKDSLKSDLDALDAMLSETITSLNIDAVIFSDETATAVTKYAAILTKKDFSTLKFKTMKKVFPTAFEYIKTLQKSGVTTENVGTIPFGITDGDKEAFIKACGAGAEHLGDSLLKVIFYEPSSYYDALVPSLEATHTGTMPSLIDFVLETGLSGSKRIEFIAEKILAIIDPVKSSPLTYLCDIIPDFIINYGKSVELLNSNENITKKLNISLPSIDSIVTEIIKALDMTAPPVDYNYIASLGIANIGESGGNNGKRTVINGDREAIFQYLANYITGLFTYENNYEVIEDILLSKIKNITSAEIQSLLYSQSLNEMISSLLDILAKNAETPKDVQSQTEQYNSAKKDYSSLFGQVLTKEKVSSIIDTIDSTLNQENAKLDINSMIFNDKIATVVAKFTAELCGAEFSDISFSALKKSFPEAYGFVVSEQSAGKTWNDIDVIPFGITDGDEEMFIKACGAGSEHFGDALALCIMVSPTSYDDGLIPILESLHTGPMPVFKDFVASSGLDGAKRMEDITRKVLTVMQPLMSNPVTYLCEILPDVVYSYNSMRLFLENDPYITSFVGLELHPIEELVGNLISSFGLTLPDHDLNEFAKMATAVTEESGDRCGTRMSLYGDKETVFVTLVNFITAFTETKDNFNRIIDFAEQLTGLELEVFKTIYSWINDTGTQKGCCIN